MFGTGRQSPVPGKGSAVFLSEEGGLFSRGGNGLQMPVITLKSGDRHRWFQCLTAKRVYSKPLLGRQHPFSRGEVEFRLALNRTADECLAACAAAIRVVDVRSPNSLK